MSRAKTSKKAEKTPSAPLPIQLDVIGWMLGGTTDDTRRALQAAQAAIACFGQHSGARHDIMGCFEDYIETYAQAHSEHLDRVRQVHPDIDDDLYCSFSGPAFLAGAAFTWLMLRGEQAEAGGAR